MVRAKPEQKLEESPVKGPKEQKASEVISKHLWWSSGAGLIPVPFVDLVAVSGVQLNMLAEIAKIYGQDFQKCRAQLVIASLIGYIVPSILSFGSLGLILKAVPGVGMLIGAPSMVLFCGASTYAVGRVFVQHFESGGTFLSFEPTSVKEFFQKECEQGRKLAVDLPKKHTAARAAAAKH